MSARKASAALNANSESFTLPGEKRHTSVGDALESQQMLFEPVIFVSSSIACSNRLTRLSPSVDRLTHTDSSIALNP